MAKQVNTTSRRPLNALTGLRFFAALMVLIHHFAPTSGIAFLDNIALHGFVTVTMFFVLSGFILTYSYMDNSGNLNSSIPAFWNARVARVYPVYVLALLLAAPRVLYHTGDDANLTQIASSGASSLALLQAWHPNTLWTWNTPGWSLSAEAFFYLVYPLISPWIIRMRTNRIWGLLAVLWLLSLIANIATLSAIGWSEDVLRFNPILRLPEFVAGIVLGKIFITRESKSTDRNWSVVTAGALVVLFVLLALPIDKAYFYNGALLPIIMVLLYSLTKPQRGIATLLSSSASVKLGEASYALYILHWPIWDISGFLLTRMFNVQVRSSIVFFATLAVALIASRIVFVYLEQPLNRLIRRRLAVQSTFAAPAA